MKRYSHFALFAVLISLSNTAQADFVNFDDGTSGDLVGSFYSSLGINFSNTAWIANKIGITYQAGVVEYDTNGQATAPLSIRDAGTQGWNTSSSPLVIAFDTPQQYVSILGVNVGHAGVRMDAYDSISGGILLGSDERYGINPTGETGPHAGNLWSHEEHLIGVTAPNIMRVELYRPNPTANDGVHYDNLTFDPVPVPGAILLGMIGLSVAGIKLRKHS